MTQTAEQSPYSCERTAASDNQNTKISNNPRYYSCAFQ
jgi:hypothetical protein